MAKCVKYYEGPGFVLAKSEHGIWYFRHRYHNPSYGWMWSKWAEYEIIEVTHTDSEYENDYGSKYREFVMWIKGRVDYEAGIKTLTFRNGEVNALRNSGFRLPY